MSSAATTTVNDEELNDATLGARLKSLTSFINNIEPTAPVSAAATTTNINISDGESGLAEATASVSPALNEKVEDNKPQTSQYYDLISEKVVQGENVGFRKLMTDVNQLKVDSNQTPLTSNDFCADTKKVLIM